MPQVIRIKRHLGNAQAPTAGQVSAGELAYNRHTAAGAGAGPDDLYVGDGVAPHLLVGAGRQVELTGNQTIAGTKTFSALPSFPGGAAGNFLATDGAGALSWAATPAATVQVQAPITGNGATGTELGVTPATYGTPASTQVEVGTNNVYPVTPAGLRSQLGAEATAANLGTAAATIVPAIKELADKLVAIVGPLHLVGTYSAATNLVVTANAPAPGSLIGQPLPAAGPTNQGWFFIVSAQGTGTAPAPTVLLTPGDWVLSDGTNWLHIDIHTETMAASNVSFATIAANGGPGISATNVQAAIAAVYAMIQAHTVLTDGTSILGDGTLGSELEVGTVDGGQYT